MTGILCRIHWFVKEKSFPRRNQEMWGKVYKSQNSMWCNWCIYFYYLYFIYFYEYMNRACMRLEILEHPWFLRLLFQALESPWNSLSFSLVLESPWILMENILIRSIVTIIVLLVMEGNSLISTHKQIFIKMVVIKKKGPLLSEYFYSLFGTCVKSNK